MEYLDPEKKRKHRQRIALGYVLIGMIISMVTLIVLLAGYGYGFDRKTGEIVQNGIMFVDTKHRQASVSINGEETGQTDLRLVLREGDYTLEASRAGYRTWQRDLTIKGGQLRKLTYGLLIPETLVPEQKLTFNDRPIRSLQSIDKDRILAWDPAQNNSLIQYDISTDAPLRSLVSLDSLIKTVVESEDESTVKIDDITFIDFDSNDTKVLVEVQIEKKKYTWLVDTVDSEQSINITSRLPQAFQADELAISMIDRNANKFYVHDVSAGEVYETELTNGALSLSSLTVSTQKVLDFTGYGNDWLLYVAESDGDTGLVDVFLKEGDTTALLKQMKTSDRYYLSLAKKGNSPFVAIGATEETAVFVYTDPLDYLDKNQNSLIPSPAAILPMKDVIDISVSNDASVVLAHNKTTLATFDFDSKENFYKELDHTLSKDDEVAWIDGQHYSYVADGIAWVVDFDGSNQQQLTAASAIGIFYRDDSEGYFSFVPNDSQDKDAPKESLVFTSLVTEADL